MLFLFDPLCIDAKLPIGISIENENEKNDS